MRENFHRMADPMENLSRRVRRRGNGILADQYMRLCNELQEFSMSWGMEATPRLMPPCFRRFSKECRQLPMMPVLEAQMFQGKPSVSGNMRWRWQFLQMGPSVKTQESQGGVQRNSDCAHMFAWPPASGWHAQIEQSLNFYNSIHFHMKNMCTLRPCGSRQKGELAPTVSSQKRTNRKLSLGWDTRLSPLAIVPRSFTAQSSNRNDRMNLAWFWGAAYSNASKMQTEVGWKHFTHLASPVMWCTFSIS